VSPFPAEDVGKWRGELERIGTSLPFGVAMTPSNHYLLAQCSDEILESGWNTEVE
jgi:hypothetical protein